MWVFVKEPGFSSRFFLVETDLFPYKLTIFSTHHIFWSSQEWYVRVIRELLTCTHWLASSHTGTVTIAVRLVLNTIL